ncbi:MAG TPA: hypothetical protein VHK06_02955 [Candidatus Limnocylindria bacterium]|nr:hypothetical protein [Candidatus Limnocylindria bacterium]
MTMSRHPTDLLSLGFGLLFAAVGLVLLTGLHDALSLTWLGPLAAILVGGIIILTARSTRADSGDVRTPD